MDTWTYLAIHDTSRSDAEWFITGWDEEHVREWAEHYPNVIIFVITVSQDV